MLLRLPLPTGAAAGLAATAAATRTALLLGSQAWAAQQRLAPLKTPHGAHSGVAQFVATGGACPMAARRQLPQCCWPCPAPWEQRAVQEAAAAAWPGWGALAVRMAGPPAQPAA